MPNDTHLKNMHTQSNEVLMFYQITLFADCLMTLISYMHTHHLVSIHVLPEDTSLNDLLYISQANGLSVLQIRCFTRMIHWLHALLHTSKGTPQYMCWWILKTLCLMYDLSHTSHLYGCSPLGMWWCIRLLCWLNLSLIPSFTTVYVLMFYQTGLSTEFPFTHITHACMPCMCWCVVRLLFQLNSFLHTSQIQGRSTIYMGWWILTLSI
jgi:hypothetical protein